MNLNHQHNIMEHQEMFTNRVDLTELRDAVREIRNEIGTIIVGQHYMVDLIIAAILADGHVLLEGVPGVAKTLTAKVVARTIDTDFSRIQFTPDLMPSDVIGTNIFNMKTSDFEFRRGPIFSNIVLIDEINRSPAKTQSALFEVMEERQVTADGTTYKMQSPFLIIATQNPIEQEGTYRLPEAQLDRFLFKIEVNYPTLEEEKQVLHYYQQNRTIELDKIRKILPAHRLQYFKDQIKKIHASDAILKYIAQLVHQTRENPALYLGASPRASIALLSGARALAAMSGRDFITPDDIKEIAYPVLVHRILLTPEKEMEGVTEKDVVKEIIDKTEVPR